MCETLSMNEAGMWMIEYLTGFQIDHEASCSKEAWRTFHEQ